MPKGSRLNMRYRVERDLTASGRVPAEFGDESMGTLVARRGKQKHDEPNQPESNGVD